MVAEVVTPWREDRVVLRTTEKLRALDQRTAGVVADAVVKMGVMIQQTRERLAHGQFLDWLDGGVHIEVRTAQRFMAVAQWALDRPGEFAKVKALSISKIYRLLTVPPDIRRTLYGRRLAIPGTDKRLYLADMSARQLDRVIDDLAPAPPPRSPVPALMKATRHRIDALEALTSDLIAHKRDVDPDDIADVHTDLVALADALEDAFSW